VPGDNGGEEDGIVSPTRRQFLQTAGKAAAALAALRIGPRGRLALAAPQTYKGVTYLTPAYRLLKSAIDGFVRHLRENARQVLDVEFYGSATLMKVDEQLAGLRDGAVP
jgi:hypothetical protein